MGDNSRSVAATGFQFRIPGPKHVCSRVVGSELVIFLDERVDSEYNCLGCGRIEPHLELFNPDPILDCIRTRQKDLLLEMI